jgi:hypothetical protein
VRGNHVEPGDHGRHVDQLGAGDQAAALGALVTGQVVTAAGCPGLRECELAGLSQTR